MSNQKLKDRPGLGLRERKKQQTRLAISDVATRMFIERGFENVTIAELAEAAQVSVNTVFNYFSTKEELFFDRGPELVREPSRIVRERKRGESAVSALRRSLRKLLKEGLDSSRIRRLKPFLSAIERSPALRAHALLLMEQSEHHLAQTLVAESGVAEADPTAYALAALLTGVQRLLARELRRRVLAGESDEAIRAELTRLAERAFELLLAGAGDFARRPTEP